jgi:hypothetical protein
VDTRIYDQRTWSPFDGKTTVAVLGRKVGIGEHWSVPSVWTGEVPIHSKDSALLRVTQVIDANGNVTEHIDHGRIAEDGTGIDNPITQFRIVAPPRPDWRDLGQKPKGVKEGGISGCVL